MITSTALTVDTLALNTMDTLITCTMVTYIIWLRTGQWLSTKSK